ncbi:toxin-antitoxin system HicB family antitoxin [Phascolarctobacterium faecium]|uniref:toxin-antitoxin system HicB family antitoxin n=2 Tax=Phascolarctobacterium faecium TaxID=33025 RepID=UPI003D7344DD
MKNTGRKGSKVMEIKQITLRLPVKLHEQLKQEAKRRGITLNELILVLIQSDEYIVVKHTQSLY